MYSVTQWLDIVADMYLFIYVHATLEAADYDQPNIFVTIAPGTMMQQFTINITNDNIVECNETFSMSISTEGIWCGLNNDNSSAQVTIINDDGKNMYVTI